MPSNRFNNLKQVKKRTFLKRAYKEFALHSYEGASITRLVADLKMAKGSIYQYFEDKEDLYNYLVAHAEKQLLEVIEKTCLLPKSGEYFDKWIEKIILIQVKFLLAIPSYALLFIKHNAEFSKVESLAFTLEKIERANKITKRGLSTENIYRLQKLPLLIFNFVIVSNKIDLFESISSDSNIELPTNKLLYLCEAFLQKS
ncbi:MAG: TetR/AcrR family transcriptional regulator [Cyclobacteriaceae bacterium]|nr:TetR/AcrR family transcriptional regulator [Cyclobacteriaceae bacterium]